MDGSEIFLFHFFKLSHFQLSIKFYVLEIVSSINKMSHSRWWGIKVILGKKEFIEFFLNKGMPRIRWLQMQGLAFNFISCLASWTGSPCRSLWAPQTSLWRPRIQCCGTEEWQPGRTGDICAGDPRGQCGSQVRLVGCWSGFDTIFGRCWSPWENVEKQNEWKQTRIQK